MSALMPSWLLQQMADNLTAKADRSERIGEAIGWDFGRRESIAETRALAADFQRFAAEPDTPG